MATRIEKVNLIYDVLDDIEDIMIDDVTFGGHPDPNRYCDLGFTVWIRGARKDVAQRIADIAQ